MKFVVPVVLFWASINFAAQTPSLHSPFVNLTAIAQDLQFFPYYKLAPKTPIKIAIFDSGFGGVDYARGNSLPQDIVFQKGTTSDPHETIHGTIMAEILYSLMTLNKNAMQWSPQLYLYRVGGYTNFKAAIADAIHQHVQIIIYPEVRDFGSNWDGHGFWNAEVNKATAEGIIWINSAGNLARHSFNGKVEFVENNKLVLPDKNNTLQFNCLPNGPFRNKCPASIFLTWNDFKDDPHLGTAKDLDLEILDSNQKVVYQSKLEQVDSEKRYGPGKSFYPREALSDLLLDAGTYFISVTSKNPKAFGEEDKFRISAEGEFLTMNHYNIAESILPPADNSNVITVGALDSDRTAVSVKLSKPDLLVNSEVRLSDGSVYKGSSNSAIIVGAGMGMLKALNPRLTRKELLEYVTAPGATVRFPLGPKLKDLEFLGMGTGGCFEPHSPAGVQLAPYANSVLQNGGALTYASDGTLKIFVHYDPSIYIRSEKKPRDAVVLTPQGMMLIDRDRVIHQPFHEVFQFPVDGIVCGRPESTVSTPKMNGEFWMPQIN